MKMLVTSILPGVVFEDTILIQILSDCVIVDYCVIAV